MATPRETDSTSERQYLRRVYECFMDTAVPGDIVFFISNSGKPPRSWKSRLYRRWLGFRPDDYSSWHTLVYVSAKKSMGEQMRPYVVHSTASGNTTEERLKPSFFSYKPRPGQELLECRTEALHFPDLSAAQRKKIVAYCRSQVGKPFDGDGWHLDFATYALGVRSRQRDPERVSCHGLAFNAYGLVGMAFAHPRLPDAPYLLGRIYGHPFGHPANQVDLRYNYLRDHHLYADQRGKVGVALVGHGARLENVEVLVAPGKYSWDTNLQAAYGLGGEHSLAPPDAASSLST